jgi:hypothetical protein
VVAFIIGNRCKENILSFQPISEKKRTLRKKKEFINITCKNIHAPTEDKEQEEKEKVYVHSV